MPSSKADVKEFFERLSILETQVKALMVFQKWQMVVLGAILMLAVKTWFR